MCVVLCWFLDLAFPSTLLLWISSEDSLWSLRILCQFSLWVLPLGSEAFSFISGIPPLNSGIACLAYLNPGIACLASQSSDWLDALWASLSWCLIKLELCKALCDWLLLGGTFNCPASTCWLIDCALAQKRVQ